MNNTCFNCFQNNAGYEVCPYCGYVAGTPNLPEFMLQPKTGLWGRYVIGSILGIGGFGVTYRAFDTRLARMVAIKEFFPQALARRMPGDLTIRPFTGDGLAEFNTQKARFVAEGKNLAKLGDEKHVVNVLEFFEDNGTAYIVMEFLSGMTLKEYINAQGGRLSQAQAKQLLTQVLSGVDAIHQKGVIHRDISPDNIFVTDEGVVKLLDFGAARFADKEEWTQSVVVKKGYAPPEQYRQNMRQSNVTDLYAVGATYYRMLTGTAPEESIQRWEKDTLQRPSKLAPNLDVATDKFTMKALALRPEIRFKTASDMLSALQSDSGYDFPENELKRRKARQTFAVVASVAVLIAVLGVAGLQFGDSSDTIASGASTLPQSVPPQELSFYADENGTFFTSLVEEFNRSTEHNVTLNLTNPKVIYNSGAKLDISDKPFDGEYADLTPLLQTMPSGNYLLIEQDYERRTANGDYHSLPIGFAYTVYYVEKVLNQSLGNQLLPLEEVVQLTQDDSELGVHTGDLGRYMDIVDPPMFVDGVFMPDNVVGTISDMIALQMMVETSNGKSDISLATTGNITYQNEKQEKDIYVLTQDGIPLGEMIELYVNADISADKQAAAMQFLNFCVSEKGQTIMHLQNEVYMPVHSAVMQEYLSITPGAEQYEDLFDLGLIMPQGVYNDYYIEALGYEEPYDRLMLYLPEYDKNTLEERVDLFYGLETLSTDSELY